MTPLSYFINKKLKITYIHDIQDRNFIKLKTPCKECLVQATCLRNSTEINTKYSKYISLNLCDGLNNYIKGKKCFEKI
jgi:hypothetical protein